MSSIPIEPIRNGTFPDEEDQTHVYKASEYGGYFIEIVYGVLVISAVCLVLMIILSHFFDDIRSRVYPESHVSEDDFYDESDRRRRLAQRRMTTVFDSAMLATPTIVVNDNLVTEWMAELDSVHSSFEEASLNEKVEDNINELPNVAIENEVQSQNIVKDPVQSGQELKKHPDDNSTPDVQARKGVRFNNDDVDISTSRDMPTSVAENRKEIPAGTTKNYRDRKTIFPKR
uniref:Uncharacterized protein n=1 Tax=Ciona savignyi TaxID=51511 RepID=H2ZIC5_CIOSA